MTKIACSNCGRFTPDSEYTPDQCRLCWLQHHDPAYRTLWNEDASMESWPRLARWLAARCRPEDRGLGDTVSRALSYLGADRIRRVIEKLIGDCGCADRRAALNQRYPYPAPPASDNREAIHLVNHLCPGDVLVMTAAVASLHQNHPGRYRITVDTTAPAIWENNPDAQVALPGEPIGRTISMEYPLIHQSDSTPYHFMEGYARWLGQALGVPNPLQVNRPQLHFSADEIQWMPQIEEILGRRPRYWVLNAGTKQDYTAKGWGAANWQELVEILRGEFLFVQIGEEHHLHPALEGVVDLRGQTDTRQLLRLCYHAEGGLGPSTFLQHIFAALHKPYLCLAGGREPVYWQTYPKQILLHSIGTLDCCRDAACWRSRTVPLGDGSEQDGSLCHQPTPHRGEMIPRCLARIRPSEVAQILRTHYNAA